MLERTVLLTALLALACSACGQEENSQAATDPAADTTPAWLYLVDSGGETSRILRVRTDGSEFELVLDSALPASRGLVFDPSSGMFIWASRDGDRIQRVRLGTGGKPVPEDVITTGLDSAYAVALDRRNGQLYWSDYGTGAIHRAGLDGSDPQAVVRELEAPRGIDLDTVGGWIYWTDVGTKKVQRSKLDGSGVQDLLTSANGLDSPYGVTVDAANNFIYVADAGTGHILRAQTDGTELSVLIPQSGPHPSFILLAPDENRLYWTDNRANRVRRAQLDGTEIEDVIPGGLAGPRGLVRVR